MAIITTILIVLAVLVANELWWRGNKVHGEFSRKFVHIAVGSFVAFWPYYLSWNQIRVLSLVFLVSVAISKYFRIFRAIHAVQRPTWGEVYFAVAVGLVTFVTHRPDIYAAAVLQMGLADGLAAVVGTKYGKGNDYKVMGASKSFAGSAAFLVASYIILLSFATFSFQISIVACLVIALAATVLENVAIRGLDNLLVPLLIAFILRLVV